MAQPQHVMAAQTNQYNGLFHNLPRGYIHIQKSLIQPRFGVAYSVDQPLYGNTSSPTFGKVTQKNNQRSLQGSLRYNF